MRKLVGILGIPIDVLNSEAALARMEQFVAEGGFHQVATVNTDFVTNSLTDPELRAILQTAALVTPDGMPIVWASRLLGAPLPERVTGADIVPLMAERAVRHGWRLYLLGARPEIANLACARLQADYPGIQIVGCMSPPAASLEEMQDKAVLADLERTCPDILLVAFGNPKQEKWIYRHREALRKIPVCMGVGGTFDFLASRTRRAPLWMQRRGLEWLFRLLHEPSRLWKRYTRDFQRFGFALVQQALALRRCRPAGCFDLQIKRSPERTLLTLRGDLNAGSLARLESEVRSALDLRTDVVLDMHALASVDGAALGALIALHGDAASARLSLRLAAIAPPISAVLRYSRLLDGLYTDGLSLAEALAPDAGSPAPCASSEFRPAGR